MSLSLLKVFTVGGICCGAIAPSTIFLTGRFQSPKGFLIAKSKSNAVQLYIKATKFKEQDGIKVATEYGLFAEYKGKVVPRSWMLCSPAEDKNKYFLLKSGESLWNWQDMEGQETRCNFAHWEDTFGEELEIEFLIEDGKVATTKPAKEIYLNNCNIDELNKVSDQFSGRAEKNNPKFVLTCSTQAHKESINPNNQIKLVDKGLF